MRSIYLGVAMLMGCVFGAHAQVVDAPVVGGPGGGPYDDPCHTGDVLVGLNYTSGKGMDTIAGVCQSQRDGELVGQVYSLGTHGQVHNPAAGATGPFGDEGKPRCPPGAAVYEMQVWVNKFNEVDSVEAVCFPLKPTPTSPRSFLQRTDTSGVATSASPSNCPLTSLAVGIVGRSGAEVDSVGLKCSPFPWHVVANPPPPPTTIVKVIAAGDVYDHPGGSGQPIYPDGLDPGAPKYIALVYLLEVGMGDNVGWYRVTWNGAPPQPLWVYNGIGNVPFDADSLATATATVNGGH